MKSLQIRLAEEVHEAVKAIALSRNTSIADVIRESLEIYVIGYNYASEGKRLIWEDPSNGERAELLIPGFTRQSVRQRHLTA